MTLREGDLVQRHSTKWRDETPGKYSVVINDDGSIKLEGKQLRYDPKYYQRIARCLPIP